MGLFVGTSNGCLYCNNVRDNNANHYRWFNNCISDKKFNFGGQCNHALVLALLRTLNDPLYRFHSTALFVERVNVYFPAKICIIYLSVFNSGCLAHEKVVSRSGRKSCEVCDLKTRAAARLQVSSTSMRLPFIMTRNQSIFWRHEDAMDLLRWNIRRNTRRGWLPCSRFELMVCFWKSFSTIAVLMVLWVSHLIIKARSCVSFLSLNGCLAGPSRRKDCLRVRPAKDVFTESRKTTGWITLYGGIYAKKLLKFEIAAPSAHLSDKCYPHVSVEGQEVVMTEANATVCPLSAFNTAAYQPLGVGVRDPLNQKACGRCD